MPQNPYLVSGTVYTSRGKVPDSIVTVGELITTTNSEGNYVVDLADMSSDYSIGTAYTITAKDKFDNEYKSDSITLAGGALTKDMYLEMRTKNNDQTKNSDTRREEIRSVGNEPVTQDNPLPSSTWERPLTQKMQNYSSGQPQYIGYAPPGTPTNQAKWMIILMEYGNGTSSPPTGRTYASGNAEFDKVWDNRTTYTYT